MTSNRIPWNNSSASQVGTFRRCQRLWWWQKVAGYQTPTSPAMELGTLIHSQLESYLTGGDVPKNAIAVAGLEYLPDPSDVRPENVERRVDLSDPSLPVPIIGYIDLVEPPDILGASRLIPTITDHKTTSNFKYIRQPDVLAHDPQAIIYSTFAFRELFPDEHEVEFRHVYYRTRGRPDSRESAVVFTRGLAEERFKGIVETVVAQSEAREQDITAIEPTLTACGDYGGCPFLSNCKHAGGMGCSASLFAGINNNPKSKGRDMGLLDKIKERKEAATPAKAGEVTINPPDGTPMDKAPEPPDQPSLEIKPPKALSVTEVMAKHSELVSELPDFLFTHWQELSPLALWHAEGRSTKRGEKPKKKEVVADVELIEKILNAPTLGEAFEAVEKGKPIPSHGGGANPLEYDSQAEPLDPPPQPDDLATDVLYEDESDRREICHECHRVMDDDRQWYDMPSTLYIGCVPRGGSANRHTIGKQVWLEDFLKPYQDRVAENRSVPHYSLIEYAKGEKEVAALIRHELRNEIRPLPTVMIADRRMAGSAAALEVLIQHYAHVVERLG